MFFSNIARNIILVLLAAVIFIQPIEAVNLKLEPHSETINNETNETQFQIEEQEQIVIEEKSNNSSEWEIEIPSINLKAEISEGTTAKVMNMYVGHFEETPEIIGNIGLAAHNRGYPVNYFKDLKLLEKGDKIYYKYRNENKSYIVDKIKVIKDTNWEMLKNTEDNRLTLITCIENEPEYRLCVQAIEIGG